MCFYTIRCGSCVTGVNEQHARADTQAAGGTRASWRCSALPVPPLGVHRERPRSPSAGVQIIVRIKSVAVSSSPSKSASRAVVFPPAGLSPRGWRGLGLAGTRCRRLARTWLTSWARLFCPQSSCPGGRLLSPKHSSSDQTFMPRPSPLC